MQKIFMIAVAAVTLPSFAAQPCQGYGPQSPRDIRLSHGVNPVTFDAAPAASNLNLCNIHTHTSAEHRGPGFAIEVVKNSDKDHDEGYLCNETDSLTEAELKPLDHPHYQNVKPGDTIEVHWVYSSCDVKPGEGLAACTNEKCANPQLRVEAQVFLLVNDPQAANFNDYTYPGHANKAGLHQPKALPASDEPPIVYTGSTTGKSYDDSQCSPYQVTWSVRPQCIKLDINSLDQWGQNNPFNEHHSHDIRELVEFEGHLSTIGSNAH